MPPSATPVLELESLLVKIMADASDFVRGTSQMTAAINQVEAQLISFAAKIQTLVNTAISPLALSLSRIGIFINAVGRSAGVNFTAAANGIGRFTTAFTGAVSGLLTPDMDKAITSLSRISGFIRTLNKMTLNSTQIANVTSGISSLFSAFQGVGGGDIEKGGIALMRVGSALTAMSKLAGGEIEAVAKGLRGLFLTMAGSASENLDAVAKSMSRVTTFLNAVRKLNQADLLSLSGTIKTFVNGLASIQVTPNAAAVVSLLQRLGLAARGAATYMKQLNLMGGTGGPPPITMNLNSMASAAGAAGRGIGGLTTRLRDLFMASNTANGSLSMLRLTIAGIAGVSLFSFARMDESLTRTLSHMRDFAQVNRPGLEGALMGAAGSSGFNIGALGKGLDILVSSGMNAAMAAHALGISEQFATASGMNMDKATRRLVDVQWTLGMAMKDTGEHFKNMNYLADLFVGIGTISGGTVEQLIDSFGHRFVTAMQMSGMSLEKAIALQGAFSLSNIRGAEASDVAARAIAGLMRSNVGNIPTWRQLGISVFDAAGKMREMSDIAQQLGAKLGDKPIQAMARLMSMNIEKRTADAIIPLVGMVDALKMMETEIGKVDGVAKKMSDMMKESFSFQMKILWNNVVNAGIAIGKILAPAVEWLAKQIESLSKSFQGLNPAVRAMIVWGGVIAAVVVPALTLMGSLGGQLVTPFMVLASLVPTIATAFGTMLAFSPMIIGIVTGLAVLSPLILSVFGGVVSILATTNSAMLQFVHSLWDVSIPLVLKFLGDIRDGAPGAWDTLKTGLVSFGETVVAIRDLVAGFFWNIKDNARIITSWLGDNWEKLVIDITGGTLTILTNISENFKRFGQALMEAGRVAFFGMLDLIKTMVPPIFDYLMVYANTFFRNLGHNIGAALKTEITLSLREMLPGLRLLSLVSPAHTALIDNLGLSKKSADEIRASGNRSKCVVLWKGWIPEPKRKT